MIAAATERRPRIGGVVPFSTVDYPGKVCAVAFVQGCPWRCRYCHNPHLLARRPDAGCGDIGWDRVRELLERRSGLLDAIVFSGGEPTADPALGEAAREVRDHGFAVGVHTAGIYPRALARMLGTVDWVGMDVKAPFGAYEAVTGVAGSGSAARASAQAVIDGAPAYEFRTTYHSALLTEAQVLELAETLSGMGARRFALQRFRAQGCADEPLRLGGAQGAPPSEALRASLRRLFPLFTYRESP